MLLHVNAVRQEVIVKNQDGPAIELKNKSFYHEFMGFSSCSVGLYKLC
jgi:hypothetical protein